MKTLAELKQKAKEVSDGIAAAEQAVIDAGDDAEAKATAEAELTRLKGEFDGLKAEKDSFEAKAARDTFLNDLNDLSEPEDDAAKALNQGGPAQPTDAAKDERDRTDLFLDWVCGEKLEGKAMDALRPKSDTLRRSKAARNSVVIPKSLRAVMFGKSAAAFPNLRDYVAGKVMYSFTNAITNPSGSDNLVPPDFRADLQQLPFVDPSVLDMVTVINAPTGAVTFPRLVQGTTPPDSFAGVSGRWISEGATKPEEEPTFEQITITAYEHAARTEVTERMLSRSSIDLEAFLGVIFRAYMQFELSRVIINGNGVAQPLGILNDAQINVVARQAAGQVNYQDITNLKYAVYRPWRGGARYVLDDTVEQFLENTVDTQGRPLFRASFADPNRSTLNGFAYTGNVENPNLGSQGDIFFGNLSAYFLAMEEEITMAKSEHERFSDNIVVFKMFFVAGGRPMFGYAFSMLGGTS